MGIIAERPSQGGLKLLACLATALLRSDLHPTWRLTLALPAVPRALETPFAQ
jgi:hypothetical protein